MAIVTGESGRLGDWAIVCDLRCLPFVDYGLYQLVTEEFFTKRRIPYIMYDSPLRPCETTAA
jgi:hypothetical protein